MTVLWLWGVLSPLSWLTIKWTWQLYDEEVSLKDITGAPFLERYQLHSVQGILVAPTSLVMTASPLDCTLCRQVFPSHISPKSPLSNIGQAYFLGKLWPRSSQPCRHYRWFWVLHQEILCAWKLTCHSPLLSLSNPRHRHFALHDRPTLCPGHLQLGQHGGAAQDAGCRGSFLEGVWREGGSLGVAPPHCRLYLLLLLLPPSHTRLPCIFTSPITHFGIFLARFPVGSTFLPGLTSLTTAVSHEQDRYTASGMNAPATQSTSTKLFWSSSSSCSASISFSMSTTFSGFSSHLSHSWVVSWRWEKIFRRSVDRLFLPGVQVQLQEGGA